MNFVFVNFAGTACIKRYAGLYIVNVALNKNSNFCLAKNNPTFIYRQFLFFSVQKFHLSFFSVYVISAFARTLRCTPLSVLMHTNIISSVFKLNFNTLKIIVS